MRYLLIACAAVFVCGVIAHEKVEIAVYYDSMDPDSQRYFVFQLIPVVRNLWDNVLPILYPYGKTTREKIDGKWSFTCQHGEEECYVNKIHACIMNYRCLKNIQKYNLLLCLMRLDHPAEGLGACLAKYTTTISQQTSLINCANGTRGDILLAWRGIDTDKIMKPLNVLPTVVINPKSGQTNIPDETARTDLMWAVCQAAKTRVSGCPRSWQPQI